jgi:hypothetical protein
MLRDPASGMLRDPAWRIAAWRSECLFSSEEG